MTDAAPTAFPEVVTTWNVIIWSGKPTLKSTATCVSPHSSFNSDEVVVDAVPPEIWLSIRCNAPPS